MIKKKVLWVSQHDPVEKELDDIRNIIGEFFLYRIAETFVNANSLKEKIEKVHPDYGVLVLPLSVMRFIVKDKRTVWLLANMRQVYDQPFVKYSDVSVKGRHMRFDKFNRIVNVEIHLEKFEG